jgi:2-desacetyl-2-hydroxyethyl bacteriochlorophyllide A dehydrogenase
MAEARAVYFTAPRSVEVRAEPVSGPDSGEVGLTSELIGISHGTERVIYDGSAPAEDSGETLSALQGSLSYPLKYGYMNVARAADGRRFFAFYPHQDRFSCSIEECISLPDELAAENAIFLPSMETAVSIVHDAAPRLGEAALVFGQGIVGLLTAQLLLRAGCSTVTAVEPSPHRREASRALGCAVVEPHEAAERVSSYTNGRGADIAVNLSADQSALQLALSAVADEGTVVEASWYGERAVSLSLGTDFHRRRLALKSSQVSQVPTALRARWSKRRRFDLVLSLLEELQPKRYITHRYPLSKAAEAFALLDEGPDDVMQIVLDPQG